MSRISSSTTVYATLIVTFLGMTLPATVFAQEKQTDERAAILRAEQNSAIVSNGGPADREASGFGGGSEVLGPKFELSNENEQVIGTFTLGYTLAKGSFAPLVNNKQKIQANFVRLGLKASAPFNGSKETDVLDFRNLGDDAKATFSITWHSASYNEGGARQKAVNQSLRQCIAEAVTPFLKTLAIAMREQAQIEADALLKEYNETLNNKPNVVGRDILEDMKDKNKFGIFLPAAETACGGTIGEESLLRTYGQRALGVEAYQAIAKDYVNDGNLIFAGAESSFGYQKYDILNRAAFVVDQTDRVGFEVTGYVGLIGGNGNWSGRLSAGYSRGYQAKDEAEFCISVPGSTSLQCLTAEDGKPIRNDTSYVKGEGRLTLLRSTDGKQRLAIAPEVNYDIGEKNIILDVPLFFQRTDASGLSGGVRAGYNVDKKDFALRLFVGLPFGTWF
jgi:hypothetical protein